MNTPSEFKSIKELRQIGDGDISGDLLMLVEGQQESLKILLSQIVNHINGPILDILDPPGVIKYWPGDTPPSDKWVFVNDGFNFDTDKYPLLAKAWPSGEIPPHKGLVVQCTEDGGATGTIAKGQVIEHTHSASASGTALSGEFYSSYDNEHDHAAGTANSHWGSAGSPGGSVTGPIDARASKTSKQPAHRHKTPVSFDPHVHDITVDKTGASGNTADHIKYNAMVRLG